MKNLLAQPIISALQIRLVKVDLVLSTMLSFEARLVYSRIVFVYNDNFSWFFAIKFIFCAESSD